MNEPAYPRGSMHSDIVKKGELLSDWAYHVLSPRRIHARDRERLSKMYECWRGVWGAMLKKLEGTDICFADDFTRQDEIGALFDGEECVGASGYRWLDLSLECHREDSYFAAWPRHVLDGVARKSPRVCVGSNLVVSSAARGRMESVKVSQALLALAVRRFKESSAQVMLGTMRNDRAMNSHAYQLGATPLAHDVQFHNVPVDLVVFDRSAKWDIGLPPIHWLAPPFSSEEETNDEDIGHLRRAAG